MTKTQNPSQNLTNYNSAFAVQLSAFRAAVRQSLVAEQAFSVGLQAETSMALRDATWTAEEEARAAVLASFVRAGSRASADF